MAKKKRKKKGGQRSKIRQNQRQQPGLSADVIAFLDNEIAEYERKRPADQPKSAKRASGGM